MPADDKLWAAFSSYVYLTAKQCLTVLGCKPDYIQVRLRRLYEHGYLDRQQKNDFSEYVYYFTQKGGEKASERGFFAHGPRWITKKSPMTLDHDSTISDFHMRLEKALCGKTHIWSQWRHDLVSSFENDLIPDAYFWINGEAWTPFEYVRAGESGYKKGESSLVSKLKAYEKEFSRSYIVMPTTQRIVNFLSKIEDELPTTRLWFTDEASYQKDILGKIWWTPKNFRDRQYSILKPDSKVEQQDKA